MNNQQINQYDMYLRVQKVMQTYAGIWAGNSRISANFTDFEGAMQTIDAYQQKQNAAHPHLYQHKLEFRKQLVEITLRIIKGVQSFAKDEKNADLGAAIDITKSEMMQCRESQLPVYCRLVHDKTIPYVNQLGDYGVNGGVLEQLRTMTEQFKGMVPETQVAISQSKEVTETIAEMFRKTTAILREQLDGKLEQFKDSQTEFYNAYFNARTVIDRTKPARPDDRVAAE